MTGTDCEGQFQGEILAEGPVTFGRLLSPDQRLTGAAWVAGCEPWWRLERWPDHERSLTSVLRQVRRGRRKGVGIVLHACEATAPIEIAGGPLAALLARWREAKPLPPMAFAAASRWEQVAARALIGLAWRDHELVGAALALPRAGNHWSFVHLVRAPDAPQGTVEMLVLACMRHFHDQGVRWATLGLMPLEGPVPLLLRLVRPCFRRWFDFEGLARFKLKFRPHLLVPLLVEHRGLSSPASLYALLKAFAGANPVGFASAAFHRMASTRSLAFRGQPITKAGLPLEHSRP